MPATPSEPAVLSRWLILAAGIVLLDQATKYWAGAALEIHRPVALLPFLNFTLTHNAGAAFSLFSDAGGWQRWFLSGLAVLISGVIVAWIRRVPGDRVWLPCALALVLGGALGNLVDRVLFGAVVDFVDVYYGQWHWPAFNLADSAISVGAVMLIISSFHDEDAKSETEDVPK